MTLKEKFNNLDNYVLIHNAPECEKIADDFAIGFAEWVSDNYDKEPIFLGIVDIKSLLIYYKKEKGL